MSCIALIPVLSKLFGNDISSKLKVPSNWKRKISNYIKKHKDLHKNVECLYTTSTPGRYFSTRHGTASARGREREKSDVLRAADRKAEEEK